MPPTQGASRGVSRVLMRLGKRSRRRIDKILAASSLVGDPEVFEPGSFAWTAVLEENWRDIREEMRKVLRHRNAVPRLRDISPDHRRIAGTDWRSFFLCGYGVKSEENLARCPKTAAILDAVPGLKTALFSILAPGAVIPRHRGVTKALIVCHLALHVPKDRQACRMWVNGHTVHWEDGKCLVFDDTFLHEVRNETGEERVVLLLQVLRPLRQPGRAIAKALLGAIRLSPFITDVKTELKRWEQKLRESEGGRRD